MKTVKLFNFNDAPNNALFNLAIENIGKSALENAAYAYSVGFYTHPQFKYFDGIDNKCEQDMKDFAELNDWLLEQGCEVNEEVYFSHENTD